LFTLVDIFCQAPKKERVECFYVFKIILHKNKSLETRVGIEQSFTFSLTDKFS